MGSSKVRYGRDALLYSGAALIALVTGALTKGPAFREWGTYAVAGYLVGAFGSLILLSNKASSTWRIRLLAYVVFAVAFVPLAVMVAKGISVSEVGILRETGERLLEQGTPYADREELARLVEERGRYTQHTAYNVYLPILSVFGLPSAVFGDGPLTDPRLFMILAALAVVLCAGRRRRTLLLVLAVPTTALGLSTGANDLPVLAFLCLAVVLVDRARLGGGALATGIAAGMKAHAWPAVPVLFAWIVVRHGWRAAWRYAGISAGVFAVTVGLPALVDPHAFVINVIRMPLQLEPVHFEANSPAPGYLLAESGTAGKIIGLALLGLAAIGMLVRLIRHPPSTALDAGRVLAVGWVLMIGLAPSTRFGYLVYPATLLIWTYAQDRARVLRPAYAGSRRAADAGPIEMGEAR